MIIERGCFCTDFDWESLYYKVSGSDDFDGVLDLSACFIDSAGGALWFWRLCSLESVVEVRLPVTEDQFVVLCCVGGTIGFKDVVEKFVPSFVLADIPGQVLDGAFHVDVVRLLGGNVIDSQGSLFSLWCILNHWHSLHGGMRAVVDLREIIFYEIRRLEWCWFDADWLSVLLPETIIGFFMNTYLAEHSDDGLVEHRADVFKADTGACGSLEVFNGGGLKYRLPARIIGVTSSAALFEIMRIGSEGGVTVTRAELPLGSVGYFGKLSVADTGYRGLFTGVDAFMDATDAKRVVGLWESFDSRRNGSDGK